jgi:hypothetical protein
MNFRIQPLALSLPALLLWTGLVTASPAVLATPDTSRIRETVTFLASEEVAGRRSGTPGSAFARKFILDQIREIGLQDVADGQFVHDFQVNGVELADLALSLKSPSGTDFQLRLRPSTPFKLRDDCRLRIWPEDLPAPPSSPDQLLVRYGPPGRRGLFLPSELLAEAQAAGAWGLILVPHPADTVGIYNRYFAMAGNRDKRLYEIPGQEPAGLLAYAEAGTAEALQSAVRQTGDQTWQAKLPETTPLSHTGHNIVAGIPAAGDSPAATLLLISHYDHLGTTDTGFFPGADDNASAVATLLETARLLIRDDHPVEIRFLFSDGEELGLLGARAYLARFGPPKMVINLDSVGRASVDNFRMIRKPEAYSPRRLILWRGDDSLPFADQFMATCSGHDFEPTFQEGSMYARGGDHAVFAEASIPSLFVFGGFHADYNTPQDLPDRILVSRLSDLARVLEHFVCEDLQQLPVSEE